MADIWIYIAVFAFGIVAGIILWEKIGVGDTYKGRVKIKQRGRGNEQSTPINVEIEPKTSRRDRRKLDRKAKKD